MDLQEFTPESGEFTSSPEDASEKPSSGDPKPRRRRRRLWLLIPAAVLAAVAIYVYLDFTHLAVKFFPHYALNRSFGRVADLPWERMAVGVLGQAEWDGVGYDVSGLIRCQTDAEGLRLAAEDFTLLGGELDLNFSGYLSAHDAALRAPGLTGGSPDYYGVSLDTPILDQAAHTGGDPDYGWYYNAGQIALFQTAADTVRETFGAATVPLSPAEDEGLKEYIGALEFSTRREDGGYRLSATAGEGESRALLDALGLGAFGLGQGDTAVEFTLNAGGTLTGVTLANETVELELLLGNDPAEEVSPWLSLRRLENGAARFELTLALTVEESAPLEVPPYTNAFTLLPRVEEAGEK